MTALQEDLELIPSTHMAAHTSNVILVAGGFSPLLTPRIPKSAQGPNSHSGDPYSCTSDQI